MIPKLSFPLEKIKLATLYQDEAELQKAKLTSDTPGCLSKVRAAYHELYFPAAPADRPYIFASMVLSLDGKMAFQDNPQGPVVASANYDDPQGGLADFWVLNVLRAHADAIVCGAKTLKSEPEVVLACFDPELTAERMEKLGKASQYPLNIIVSLDGTDVPLDHSIFSLKEIQTIIATSQKGGLYLQGQYGDEALLVGPYHDVSEIDVRQVSAQIQTGLQGGKRIVLMTGADEPDAGVFLYILRQIGIKHLLIESPTYMWLLMSRHMLDEFFVDYSSLFIGGAMTPGYSIGFSHLDHPHSKFLVIALHQNRFLFTRQKLVYDLHP